MIAGRDALSRYLKRTAALALLLALTPAAAAAQQGRLATGNWTRGLVGGWGHSWTPGYGKTKSDVQFVAFHPQLGRFVTNHLELYGEGTLFLYSQPETAVGGGAAAIGGRYHVWDDRGWTPYVVAISGLIWTNLSIPELDRVFNFSVDLRRRHPGGAVPRTRVDRRVPQSPHLERRYRGREPRRERRHRPYRSAVGSTLDQGHQVMV